MSNKESIEEIYINKIENVNKMAVKDGNIKVELNEIKESDQNKFIKQVINMVNDIFQNHDDKISKELINIINSSYKQFHGNNILDNVDLVMKEFFTCISLYISNQSLGKFQEAEINLLIVY